MKTLRLLIAGLLLVTASLAQTPTYVALSNAQQPSINTVAVSGTTGSTTYCYWVVAVYTGGKSGPAGPLCVYNANATLSASNLVTVTFSAPTTPVAAVSSYDLLRTTSFTPPTGACACAVSTAQSGSPLTDTSNSLSAYTVATLAAVPVGFVGDNVSVSAQTAVKLYNGTTVSLAVSNPATTVNYLQVDNSATGSAVAIEPIGTDSTIKTNIKSKGAVAVQMNGTDAFDSTGVALATVKQSTSVVNTAFSTPPPMVVGNISSVTDVNGKIWYSQVFIPTNVTLTGICVQSGSATTDTFTMGIYNMAGTLLRSSALTGATLATASAPNCQNLTATLAVSGPGSYFLAIQGNGTTAASFFVYGAAGVTGFITGSQAGTFGTLAAISSPATSFTASVGPVMTVW